MTDLAQSLEDLPKNGQLQKFTVEFYMGSLNKMFQGAVGHFVSTDNFNIATINDEEADDISFGTYDEPNRVEITISNSQKSMFYGKVRSEWGDQELAKNNGSGFNIMDIHLRRLSQNIAWKVNKDMATNLDVTGTNFVAGRLVTGTADWATSATATPRADVKEMKRLLTSTSNIKQEDARLKLILSGDRADEAMDTAEFIAWEGNINSPINERNREAVLSTYFKVDVVILEEAMPVSGDIYTDITVLTVVDRNGLSGNIMIPDGNTIPNDSGLLCAFIDFGMITPMGDTITMQLDNGLQGQFSNAMIKPYWHYNPVNDNIIVGCKSIYKVYAHKTDCLIGLQFP